MILPILIGLSGCGRSVELLERGLKSDPENFGSNWSTIEVKDFDAYLSASDNTDLLLMNNFAYAGFWSSVKSNDTAIESELLGIAMKWYVAVLEYAKDSKGSCGTLGARVVDDEGVFSGDVVSASYCADGQSDYVAVGAFQSLYEILSREQYQQLVSSHELIKHLNFVRQLRAPSSRLEEEIVLVDSQKTIQEFNLPEELQMNAVARHNLGWLKAKHAYLASDKRQRASLVNEAQKLWISALEKDTDVNLRSDLSGNVFFIDGDPSRWIATAVEGGETHKFVLGYMAHSNLTAINPDVDTVLTKLSEKYSNFEVKYRLRVSPDNQLSSS